jgi:hypothetical protein
MIFEAGFRVVILRDSILVAGAFELVDILSEESNLM